jgi:hypothetical protein
MEPKFENLLNVFPDVTSEARTEMQARLATVIEVARQNVLKDRQIAVTEAFFNLLEPARRNRLDGEIDALHGTHDGPQFRAQLLLMLLSAFNNGMQYQYQVSVQILASNAPTKKR